MSIPEGVLGNTLVHTGLLTACMVVTGNGNIVLVQHDEVPAVPADLHIRTLMDITVQGLGSTLALFNGIDGELGPVVHVAAHEDIGLGGLVGQRIGHGVIAAPELHLGSLQQAAPLNGLANGKDHMVCCQLHGLVLVINGREPLGLGVDGPQALLEDNGGHMAVFVHLQLLGTPAIVDLNVFLQSLGNLIVGGRHGSPIFQADHGDLGSAEALGSLGTVNGHVAAADDHHIALHLLVLVLQSTVQELQASREAKRS